MPSPSCFGEADHSRCPLLRIRHGPIARPRDGNPSRPNSLPTCWSNLEPRGAGHGSPLCSDSGLLRHPLRSHLRLPGTRGLPLRPRSREVVVVSPDVGGVARARAFAKQMNDAPLAIIDKRRTGHNMAESLTVIGDVNQRTAILIDDMIDTGGTICAGARLLRQQGASRVIACNPRRVLPGIRASLRRWPVRTSGGYQQRSDSIRSNVPATQGSVGRQHARRNDLAHS